MVDTFNDIKKLSFEEALSELEQIVENLENGTIDLEKSIDVNLFIAFKSALSAKIK